MSSFNQSKVPVLFPPLITNHNKVNQTCTTNLITELDEVTARYHEDIDYDLYQNIVEKQMRPMMSTNNASKWVRPC